MPPDDIFDILILLGRPAAGKSEILDYLTRITGEKRVKNFHLGNLDVIDDFPMLWTWFEEDDILSEKLGKPRLHSDRGGYFKYPYLWDLLIERIGLEYQKRIRDNGSYHLRKTTVVEFSRGTEHGGYRRAFEHLSARILERAGILYVEVSYEESFRKNRKRFNPERPDSILEHALDDEKLEKLYRHDDFQDLISESESPGSLSIGDYLVPYVIFENEDDVTSTGGAPLGDRLEARLTQLWEMVNQPR
jgi:hypothetical protein